MRTHTNVVAATAVPVVEAGAELAETTDTRDVASADRVGLHRALRAGSPARSVGTLARLAKMPETYARINADPKSGRTIII